MAGLGALPLAGSLLCGVTALFRLRPPLGQLASLDGFAHLGHALPGRLLLLTLLAWYCVGPPGAVPGLLYLLAGLLHLRRWLVAACVAGRPPAVAPDGWRPPWPLRAVPLSVLPGLIPALRRGVALAPNIDYCLGKPGRQRCRLDVWHRPWASSEPLRPVLLYFHGGAWNGGFRHCHADIGFLLHLAKQGWVVVCASYRFTLLRADAAAFPACLEDCVAAARWVAEHAAEYGGDAGELTVMGASAGGHLAALLTAHLSGVPSPALPAPAPALAGRVRRCVLMYPVLDVRDEGGVGCPFPPGCSFFLGPLAARESSLMKWFLGAVVLRDQRADPALWRALDPMSNISATLPPVLIVHGTRDSIVPIEHSREYIRRLQALRTESARGQDLLLELPGGRHSASIFVTRESLAMYHRVQAWLTPSPASRPLPGSPHPSAVPCTTVPGETIRPPVRPTVAVPGKHIEGRLR